MPVEAAACFDSSPFAWLQPPILLAADTQQRRIPSSPFPAATTRNLNDDVPRPLQIFAPLSNCIEIASPDTAALSASLRAANCSSRRVSGATAHVRLFYR